MQMLWPVLHCPYYIYWAVFAGRSNAPLSTDTDQRPYHFGNIARLATRALLATGQNTAPVGSV